MQEPSGKEIVASIGDCTGDVLDCEIMRAAITLKRVEGNPESNLRVLELQAALVVAACSECRTRYLSTS